MGRRELVFQNHVIDSCKLRGGYGKKWSSEWQGGNPDLVLSLPIVGVFLLELKHCPTWQLDKWYKNPLTPKQMKEAKSWVNGGGLVLGGVVIGDKAVNSKLCVFNPTSEHVLLKGDLAGDYNLHGVGTKYPMNTLLTNWRLEYV